MLHVMRVWRSVLVHVLRAHIIASGAARIRAKVDHIAPTTLGNRIANTPSWRTVNNPYSRASTPPIIIRTSLSHCLLQPIIIIIVMVLKAPSSINALEPLALRYYASILDQTIVDGD